MIKKELIQDKYFLDGEGIEWVVDDVAGTGEYSWYCRNIDTDQKERFETEYILKKIASYEADIKYFKNKSIKESDMFNLIKKLSEQVLRKEILDSENWTNEDIVLLNELRQGKFNIETRLKYDN